MQNSSSFGLLCSEKIIFCITVMRNENKPAVMMKIRFYFKDPNCHIHEDKVDPWKHKVRITTVVFFIFLFIQLRQVKLHE
jgi:hypothetical protein